jgi:hypothetical protein
MQRKTPRLPAATKVFAESTAVIARRTNGFACGNIEVTDEN